MSPKTWRKPSWIRDSGFVKAWRLERSKVPVTTYVPLSFALGEAYRFGWSHETITLSGLPLMVNACDVTLDVKLFGCFGGYIRRCRTIQGFLAAKKITATVSFCASVKKLRAD